MKLEFARSGVEKHRRHIEFFRNSRLQTMYSSKSFATDTPQRVQTSRTGATGATGGLRGLLESYRLRPVTLLLYYPHGYPQLTSVTQHRDPTGQTRKGGLQRATEGYGRTQRATGSRGGYGGYGADL